MILQNLHTHTIFSDGKNTPEEMVLAALNQGCTSLGFSEHSTFPFGRDGWAMENGALPRYMEEIRRLQEKYAGQMDIFLGMEMDVDSMDPRTGWDYLIGSVHYIHPQGVRRSIDFRGFHTEETIREYFGGDAYAYTAAYFQRVATVYEETGCQIVGHLDLAAKFNHQQPLFDETHPRYLAAAAEAVDTLNKHDVIFEINTGAMSRGYRTAPYPSPALLKMMREHNCRICITSDTHSAGTIFHAFDEARELAKSCGYKESWILTKDGFIPQAL